MLVTLTVAHAFSTGSTPAPEPGEFTFDCGQCHNQTGNFLDVAPPEARPTLTMELVGGSSDGSTGDPLVLDEPRALRVRVDSPLSGAERALGVAMAVVALDGSSPVDRAGLLDSTDGILQPTLLENGDLTHRAPIAWTDGTVTLDLELTPTQTGDLALYLVTNDVDGDGEPSAEDYVWPRHLCFTVGEAQGGDRSACDADIGWVEADEEPLSSETEPRGCATVPASAGLVWLWAVAAMRRRAQLTR